MHASRVSVSVLIQPLTDCACGRPGTAEPQNLDLDLVWRSGRTRAGVLRTPPSVWVSVRVEAELRTAPERHEQPSTI